MLAGSVTPLGAGDSVGDVGGLVAARLWLTPNPRAEIGSRLSSAGAPTTE